jgi:hypothetical protein
MIKRTVIRALRTVAMRLAAVGNPRSREAQLLGAFSKLAW